MAETPCFVTVPIGFTEEPNFCQQSLLFLSNDPNIKIIFSMTGGCLRVRGVHVRRTGDSAAPDS
jgi:hypothetical protein